MSDRHRTYTPSGRSATFNTNRASLPNGFGYDDAYLMPSSSRHYPTTTPTRYATTTTSNGAPATTRTYAITQDPRIRQNVRDPSRTRRSTLDSTTRPPVIVTTTTQKQGGNRSPVRSPVRGEHRQSDYYAQPASSTRSRSSTRPYYEERPRYKERERNGASLSARDAETYRNSRPSVVYPSDPRHSTAAIDYGDEGYKYTNAGELVRYDLDHPGSSHRRHDSFDRGYSRPVPGYPGDSRYDPGKGGYVASSGRQYERSGGPPPSTRGFEKVNRLYETHRDRDRDRERDREVPPPAPVPPNPKAASQDATHEKKEPRRNRPVSISQEEPLHYRTREDERSRRGRERDQEQGYDDSRFLDESVTSRGFGIRTGPVEEPIERYREPRRAETRREEPRWDETRREDFRREEPRREEPRREEPRREEPRREEPRREEPRREEPRKDEFRREEVRRDEPRRTESRREDSGRRVDEESSRTESTLDREQGRSSQPSMRDDQTTNYEPSRGSDEGHSTNNNHHVADTLAAGLGITTAAAAAVGLKSAGKSENDDSAEHEPKDTRRRSPPSEASRRLGHDAIYGSASVEKETPREERRLPADRAEQLPMEAPRRSRRDADGRSNGESAVTSSDSDENRTERRRHRSSKAFNPNDPGELRQIKDQLAAMEVSERDRSRAGEKPSNETALVKAPPSDESDEELSDEDNRHGRELVLPSAEDRHVRVVSPPRDKKDDKPRKGILKQPKASFPEENNPVREGVAPHKEDKKLKDVPSGARWTKINRKIVNPEALTIGKERFEVRDDFVIVLRVLDKEEIQAYAAATQVLRERRRNRDQGDDEDEQGRDREDQKDRDSQDDSDRRSRRHHHHHRHHKDDGSGEDDAARDRATEPERRRRRHREDEDEHGDRQREPEHHHRTHHRAYRERDNDRDRGVEL